MELALYQIVVVIFAIIMISHGFINYAKKGQGQTLLKLAVRLLIWGGMAIVVLFPKITNTLAKIIGIEGNLNAVILTGFLLGFLMIFKLLSAIEKLEQQITSLTRKDTLEELPTKKN